MKKTESQKLTYLQFLKLCFYKIVFFCLHLTLHESKVFCAFLIYKNDKGIMFLKVLSYKTSNFLQNSSYTFTNMLYKGSPLLGKPRNNYPALQ